MRNRIWGLPIGIVVLLPAIGGCSRQTLTTADPKALVRHLITYNQLENRQGEDAVGLPIGHEWDHLTLAYFPGGLAVSWSDGFVSPTYLLFSSDGRFLCEAIQYLAIPLAKKGVHDLLTAENHKGGVSLVVRSLGAPVLKPIVLASMAPESYSALLLPVPWDFNGDGVFELISCVPAYSISDNSFRVAYFGKGTPLPESSFTLVAWSLRAQEPTVVLALSSGDYALPVWGLSNLSVDNMDVTYDMASRRFIVSDTTRENVFVNRAIPE
jgi:hypothetical protein